MERRTRKKGRVIHIPYGDKKISVRARDSARATLPSTFGRDDVGFGGWETTVSFYYHAKPGKKPYIRKVVETTGKNPSTEFVLIDDLTSGEPYWDDEGHKYPQPEWKSKYAFSKNNPRSRKNARGARDSVVRFMERGGEQERALSRREHETHDFERIEEMPRSPKSVREFEKPKKTRKGKRRYVRNNPVEYLTADEYMKGLDAGLFEADDPRIRPIEKRKIQRRPKEAYWDGFEDAKSAWHKGHHTYSDITRWMLDNAESGSLLEERSSYGDEYRRGAEEYFDARQDAESRRAAREEAGIIEGSDYWERGLNNPRRPKGYRSTGWEKRKFGDGKLESRGLHAGESMWFKGDYVIELYVSPGHPRSSTYTLQTIDAPHVPLGRFSTLADAKGAGDQRAKKNPSGIHGSGPRGGYTAAERAALPASDFLVPSRRKWPVSNKKHANIALQYMTRWKGLDAAKLIRKLAKDWPVDENPDLWKRYSRLKPKIEKQCGCKVPSLSELKGGRRNPRRNPGNPEAAEAMRLHHEEGMSLKEAWRRVRGGARQNGRTRARRRHHWYY